MKSLARHSLFDTSSRYIYAQIDRDGVVNRHQGRNGPEWGREAQNELASELRKKTKATLEVLKTTIEQEKVLEAPIKRGDTAGALVLGLLGKEKFSYSLPVEYLSTKLQGKKKPSVLRETNLIYPGQIIKVRLEASGPKVYILDAGQKLPESAAEKAVREEKERLEREAQEKKAREAAARAAREKAEAEARRREQESALLPQQEQPPQKSPSVPLPVAPPQKPPQAETHLKKSVKADQFVDMNYENLPEGLKMKLEAIKTGFSIHGSTEVLWDELEEVMDDWGSNDELELSEMLEVLNVTETNLTDVQRLSLAEFMQSVETESSTKVTQYLGDRMEKINSDTYFMRFANWVAGREVGEDLSETPIANIFVGATRGIEKSVSGILGLAGIDLNPNAEGLFKVPDILHVANGVTRLIGVNFEPGKDWFEEPLLLRVDELGGAISALGTRLGTVYEQEGLSAAIFDVSTAVGELFPPAALVSKIGKVRMLAGVQRVGRGAMNGARVLGRGAQNVGQRVGQRAGRLTSGARNRFQNWRTSITQQSFGDRLRNWTNKDLRITNNIKKAMISRKTLLDGLKANASGLDSLTMKTIQKDIGEMGKALKEMQKQFSDISRLGSTHQRLFRTQMREMDDLLNTYQRAQRQNLMRAQPSGFRAWKEKWLGGVDAKVKVKMTAYDDMLKFMEGRKAKLGETSTTRLTDDIAELETFTREIDNFLQTNRAHISDKVRDRLVAKKDALKALRDDFQKTVDTRNASKAHIDDIRDFIARELKTADLDKMNKATLEQRLIELEKKDFNLHLNAPEVTEGAKRMLKGQQSLLNQKKIHIESLIQKRIAHIDAMRTALEGVKVGSRIKIGRKVFVVEKLGNKFAFDATTGTFEGKLTVKQGSTSGIEWKMKNAFPDETSLEKIVSIR